MVACTCGAVTLAVWPWAASPFHDVKWALLGAGVVGALPFLARGARPGVVPLAAAVWLGLALTAPGAPWPTAVIPALILVWSLCGVGERAAAGAVAGAGGLSAAVLLQAVGVDPFAHFGPAASGRLALYGTAGNPDFAASALTAGLPLALAGAVQARGWRRAMSAGVALTSLLALALTRSFATLAALLAGALLLVAVTRSPWRFVALLAIAFVGAPLASRSLPDALAGRLYLHEVGAPHVLDAPARGLGHGAVESLWPLWELELWQARCGVDPGCVERHPQARFAGLQDHLHDDWLELTLTLGIPGLAAVVALVGAALGSALRRRDALGLACAASLLMVSVRALADFPLHRPIDGCLLALVCSLACASPPVRRRAAGIGEEGGGDVERTGGGAPRPAGQGAGG